MHLRRKYKHYNEFNHDVSCMEYGYYSIQSVCVRDVLKCSAFAHRNECRCSHLLLVLCRIHYTDTSYVMHTHTIMHYTALLIDLTRASRLTKCSDTTLFMHTYAAACVAASKELKRKLLMWHLVPHRATIGCSIDVCTLYTFAFYSAISSQTI